MGFRAWGRRLAGIFGRDRAASELEEEMRLHMELRARQLRQQGLAAEEARYTARRRFGNELAVHDASAGVWGWTAWERLLGDFRHAFRSLRKAPGFTAVAVATLAVGLGMNLAVFSLVDAVMLRSLPYAEPDRLVSLWEEESSSLRPAEFNSSGTPLGGRTTAQRTTVSPANLADYGRSPAFADLASFDLAAKNLTGLGTPERLQGEAVSANFFNVLGVKPALGRSFLPEEDRDGAAGAVIITDQFWRDRLGADTDVLARSITLDAQLCQIVGVLPPGSQSPYQLTVPDRVEFFVPAAYTKQQLSNYGRGDHDVNAVARLRPGVSVRQAQAELNVISANLAKEFRSTNRNIRAAIAPLRDDIARNVRQSLWILLGASALIVLIACVNLANLMLVRAVRRQHESSVRMALGGGRWSLVRQYLAESLTLAGAGCGAGMAAGYILLRVLVWLAPQNIPRIQNVSMDWQVFAVAAAVALVTGLVFGVAPAWQSSQAKAADALKTSARSTGARAQARWRSSLTAAEIALSLILLVGAGLLLRSFVRVMGVDLGFQPERVLALNINLPELRYSDADRRLSFFEELERRVTALPGVESVAFANRLPLRGGWSSGIELESAPDVEVEPGFQAVSSGYFETLGIGLERGRLLVRSDRRGQPPVAVVNQAFARQYLQGADPIGRRFHRDSPPWVTIVGMVNDIRRGGKTAELIPQVYLSAAQTDLYPVRLADFAARTRSDPRQLVNAVQRQVWAIDKDQPVTNVRTLEEIISQSVAERRFEMVLLIAFAAVAVLLATIGIFGVLSYIVNQRMGELGIRVALGATPERIVAMVLRQAGWWIAIGIGVGLGGAFTLARYLESLLFEVRHGDPWTYLAAVALLLAVSLAAALIPARRGAKVDPMTALRYE
ncbi:MAG: ABC transporter permease [Bryobacteraceae bacterium]|jgi:putative ABC transport system permease protein